MALTVMTQQSFVPALGQPWEAYMRWLVHTHTHMHNTGSRGAAAEGEAAAAIRTSSRTSSHMHRT